MTSVLNDPTDQQVTQWITGWSLGGGDGVIICDGCGSRVSLDIGQRVEMTGYATTKRAVPQQYANRVGLLKVYCEDCEREEVRIGTAGVAEFIVRFVALRDGAQASALNVEVIDRSGRGDGH